MTQVNLSTKLAVPAQAVWSVIGSFNGLPDWHPAIEKSEQTEEDGATLRTLSLAGGGTLVERLAAGDDHEQRNRRSLEAGSDSFRFVHLHLPSFPCYEACATCTLSGALELAALPLVGGRVFTSTTAS